MTDITPEPKIVGMLDRRKDRSIEDFHRHWSGPHADEARKLVPRFIRYYVQNHSRHRPIAGFAEACDGSPVVWVHDEQAAAGMSQSEEYRTGAWLDEPRFMEARSRGFVGREEVVQPGPPMGRQPDGYKAMFFLKRREDVDRETFVAAWRELDRPLVHAEARSRRYIRTPAMDADAWFDGLEEIWWEDAEAFEADWQARVRPPAAELLDEPASRAMLVEEIRVVWPE